MAETRRQDPPVHRVPAPVVLAVAIGGAVALVGGARKLVEAYAVNRGRLPRSRPAVQAVPPDQWGPVARRLGNWVPTAPAGPVTGRLATAWSAPLTAAGWLLALVGGRIPRYDERLGAWVAAPIRGPLAWWFRISNTAASGIGRVIICRSSSASRALIAHELIHVRQAERLGPTLPLLYGWWLARHGYRKHPLEHAARVGAARATVNDPR